MPEAVVSVIMPAFNAGNFIAESIESVIHQTYANWQLLIVDDGSTDNTKQIIFSYCEQDKRIRYLYQQNGKQGKARNLALKHSVGSYIAFIDADDIWVPEKLAIQLEEIAEKKVDLVFSDCKIFSSQLSDNSGMMGTGIGYFEGHDGLCNFLEKNRIVPSSVLMTKSSLDSVNYFVEELSMQNAEDYHLWLKLLMNGYKFFGSPSVLAYYRWHDSSASFADKLSVAKSLEVLEDLKGNNKPYKKLLTCYQKLWFKRYHYSTNNWHKQQYKQLLRKNCSYTGMSLLNIVILPAYYFFGFEFTRKLINKIVNNTDVNYCSGLNRI